METNEPTRYCLNCKYVLDGLPENRRPECGQQFDPGDARTYWDGLSQTRHKKIALAVGRVAISPPVVVLLLWANLVVPLCFPVAVPLALLSVARNLVRRRWVRATATVVFCLLPFGYQFTCGIEDYCRGAGTLRYMGLPGTEFHNIDPTYRCGRSTGGCVIRGAEPIINACYDGGLKTMIHLFGPMPGAYVGPYPTKQETLAALRTAEAVDFSTLLSDHVRLSSVTINLDTGVGTGLLRRSSWEMAIGSKDDLEWLIKEVGPITATVCQGCLVLRVPSDIHTYQDDVPSAMIVVIDSTTGRPFAYYGEGDYSHHFPPVRWRE